MLAPQPTDATTGQGLARFIEGTLLRTTPTLRQPPESTVGQPCGSVSAVNIHRIFGGIFEMLCAEWCTGVDGRRMSTVESKSKAFAAVDSGACLTSPRCPAIDHAGGLIRQQPAELPPVRPVRRPASLQVF
eukprot:6968299-Pyramimonas_sp.AAC.2